MSAEVQNTLIPYSEIQYGGIQYSNCRDYDHISRYKGLRQVIHNYESTDDRFIALETSNTFESDADVVYHTVTVSEENRLDVLAYKYLGSATYAWIIAYFNDIEDGFTVRAGAILKIPKNVTALFSQGELLGNVNALKLNLGTE